MILVRNELKEVEFAMKSAVGGGGNRSAVTHKRYCCVERARCVDAKRSSLYKAAGQLGSEAAKLFVVEKFVKLLSLPERKLFTLAPMGRESGCNQFNYNHERGGNSILCRGVKIYKNSDRATECAMTNVDVNFLKTPVGWAFHPNNETFINPVKITHHSEDNYILSPKNLLKGLQEDLSLSAQDDENVEKVVPSPKFLSSP